MFELLKIKFLGIQPVAKVTNKMLERLIQREFGDLSFDVMQRFNKIESDTKYGKNRIAAAILKLSKKDLMKIEFYIKQSNYDFRDVISKAEYPRYNELGFENVKENKKQTYSEDWIEYMDWIKE